MKADSFLISSSAKTQQWGNAESFVDYICEGDSDRSFITEPIRSPATLNSLITEKVKPHLATICDGDHISQILFTQETFIAHKQSIDLKSSKSILVSSASAYTCLYTTGHYLENAPNIFFSEREEVLSQLSNYLKYDHKGLGDNHAESKTLPVFSTYSWSGNIQHLIIEGLTQLILFDEFTRKEVDKESLQFSPVYPLPDNEFAMELGNILFGDGRIIKRPGNFQKVYRNSLFLIPQQINFSPLLASSKYAISLIKRRIAEWASREKLFGHTSGSNNRQLKKKVFLCRKPDTKNSTSRCINNLDRIIPILRSNDIDIIHPEDLSVTQRAKILPEYHTIIIEDGASFMNLLFTEAKEIAVLAHPLFHHNRGFFSDFTSACYAGKTQPQLHWVDNILDFGLSVDDLWRRDDRFNIKYDVNIDHLQHLVAQLGTYNV